MFHVAGPLSNVSCLDENITSVEELRDEYQTWTCSLNDSYFHSFAMLLSGDFLFFDSPSGLRSTLSFIFAAVIGIILLNILIAVVNDSFKQVEDNSEYAFWLGRLRFIVEMQGLLGAKAMNCMNAQGNITRKRRIFTQWDNTDSYSKEMYGDYPPYCFDLIHWVEKADHENPMPSGNKNPMPNLVKRIHAFFLVAQWNEIIPPSEGFRKVIAGAPRRDDVTEDKAVAWSIASIIFVGLIIASPIIILVTIYSNIFDGPIENKSRNVEGRIDTIEDHVKDLKDVAMKNKKKYTRGFQDVNSTLAALEESQAKILILLLNQQNEEEC